MKTNDETINITINKIRTQNFHDKELEKQVREKRSTEIRITEIELTTKNGKNTQKYLQAIYPSINSPCKI